MMPQGFRPAWWLPGPHLQTLGARLLRKPHGVVLRRERLELPDGDFLDLDWADGQAEQRSDGSTDGLIVVLHGLEGSARSKYVLELHRRLAASSLPSVGMNFRSCSGEPNRLPRLYHSGETGDLRHVLGVLRDRFPDRPLGVVGFSLGGNVLLKHLGEAGDAARGLVRAAAAVSAPFDLAAGADRIQVGFSNVYLRYLVRKLRRKVIAKRHLLDSRVDLPRLMRARTFWEFDDAGTAPLHGFAGARDYYARSSSGPYLTRIAIPTLIIHSRDDPFLGPEAVPDPVTLAAANPQLELMISERGGHVGFVSGPPWSPVFWAEARVAEWLAARIRFPSTP